MKIIDSHIHVHSFYNKIGQSCIEWMNEYQSKHCEAANVCALSHGAYVAGNCTAAENVCAALIKANCEGAFAYAGLVYPSYPVRPDDMPEGFDALTQYRELMEIGFDGLKSFENKPSSINVIDLPICDPYYDPFYAEAEKDGTHMIWHVADPEANWMPAYLKYGNPAWYCGEGRCIPWEDIYARVYNVLDRFPRLNITFAHFFFLSEKPDQLEELFEKYPDVSIDLTRGTEMYTVFDRKRDFYRDFIIRYADRIVYGTDCSFHESVSKNNDILAPAVRDFVLTDKLVDHIWGVKLRGFAFPEDVAEKLLSKNFLKHHAEPKPINRAALSRYIEKYAPTVKNEDDRREMLAFAERYL